MPDNPDAMSQSIGNIGDTVMAYDFVLTALIGAIAQENPKLLAIASKNLEAMIAASNEKDPSKVAQRGPMFETARAILNGGTA